MLYIVKASYVDPTYTSKMCNRCGHIGDRNGKSFKYSTCGHVDHADSNAGCNIAKCPCIDRSTKERDLVEGTTDSRKVALA
ncbi:MAG: zinc ribbon domain-containing protein [Methanotrichaceae archaeon]